MRKKILIAVLCVVVLALVAGGIVLKTKLPQPLSYPIDEIAFVGTTVNLVSEDTQSVTLQKPGNAPWRVLLFTDQHLDGNNKTSFNTVDYMVRAIAQEKPDLVLVGGDNVTSGMNKKRSHQFAEIFEKLGVYWGGVLGNHEGDNKYSISRTEMVDIFSSYDHCVMRRGPENIDGDCNYVIRLTGEDGSLQEAIFCIDTFDEIDDGIRATHEIIEGKSYDGAHENQVAWYEETASKMKAELGDFRSLMLLHIPLPAYDRALESGRVLYGQKNEGVCSTAYENGLFEAIKRVGVTQAVFCGHDHVNNFGAEYEGVLLSYIETSGYGSYGFHKKGLPEEEWLQGYTRLDVLPDGTFSQEQLRYSVLFGGK